MNYKQFEREVGYQISLAIVKDMLDKGLITPEDYHKWEQLLAGKYDPPIGRIVSNP